MEAALEQLRAEGFAVKDDDVALCFRSDDIRADHEMLVRKGLTPSLLPGSSGARSFVFRDPTNVLCFVYCL